MHKRLVVATLLTLLATVRPAAPAGASIRTVDDWRAYLDEAGAQGLAIGALDGETLAAVEWALVFDDDGVFLGADYMALAQKLPAEAFHELAERLGVSLDPAPALPPAYADEATRDAAGGPAEATSCGFTCSASTHPTYYTCKPGCSGSCSGPSYCDNAVNCEPNTGSAFRTCTLVCPGGYHVSSWDCLQNTCSYTCSGCPFSYPCKNSSYCIKNPTSPGSRIYACGGCPSGFRLIRTYCSNSCTQCTLCPSAGNNTYECAKL